MAWGLEYGKYVLNGDCDDFHKRVDDDDGGGVGDDGDDGAAVV